MTRRVLTAVVVTCVAAFCGPAITVAMTISINPVAGGGLDPTSANYNAAAANAFTAAANDLGNRFSDPITVNVTADLNNTSFGNNSNIIGQTSPFTLVTSYSNARSSLVADATANPGNNTLAVENALPPSNPTFTLPAGGTGANNSYTYSFANTGSISATKADLKALGFPGLDTQFGTSDGSITFNSSFAFSYNGPAANKIDFKTTAEHELIHLLGFNSATDRVDADRHVAATSGTGGLTGNTVFNINPSVLDLYRFSSGNVPDSLAAFSVNPRDLVPGSTDYTSDTTTTVAMSTGVYYGDGNQASHWKDDAFTGITLGIMDPTLGYNQAIPVGSNDVRSLQLMGYDAVPEPGSVAILFAGGVLTLLRRRPAIRHPDSVC